MCISTQHSMIDYETMQMSNERWLDKETTYVNNEIISRYKKDKIFQHAVIWIELNSSEEQKEKNKYKMISLIDHRQKSKGTDNIRRWQMLASHYKADITKK